MEFSREENGMLFAKVAKLILILNPRNLFFWITSSRGHRLRLVTRLSSNSIKFVKTFKKLKKSLKPLPWGNCAIEFPQNIVKVAKIDYHEIFVKDWFAKINSREILGKAQMAKINYREMSEKGIRENSLLCYLK